MCQGARPDLAAKIKRLFGRREIAWCPGSIGWRQGSTSPEGRPDWPTLSARRGAGSRPGWRQAGRSRRRAQRKMAPMAGHECYHCKSWIAEGEPHDCWTTTEAALTADLSDDLRDAWERLRDTAIEFGPQRIYASHNSIMFSRKACYFFVRPKRTFLEVCVFLGRTVRASQVRRADRTSKTKVAHIVPIRHRDQVESPITDWLREAYALEDTAEAARATAARPRRAGAAKK